MARPLIIRWNAPSIQQFLRLCNNNSRSRQRYATRYTIPTPSVPTPHIAGGMANDSPRSHWAPSQTIPPLRSLPMTFHRMAFHTYPNRDGRTVVYLLPISLSQTPPPTDLLQHPTRPQAQEPQGQQHQNKTDPTRTHSPRIHYTHSDANQRYRERSLYYYSGK